MLWTIIGAIVTISNSRKFAKRIGMDDENFKMHRDAEIQNMFEELGNEFRREFEAAAIKW